MLLTCTKGPHQTCHLHLTRCKDFVCNSTYYKCPGFYCIPWQYVCNTRTDCPGGLDERDCNKTTCLRPRQFSCRSSARCVAMEDICNGVADCPFQDDEYYCDSFQDPCPTNCTCLIFAIKCSNVNFVNFSNSSWLLIFWYAHLLVEHNPGATVKDNSL